MAWIRACGGGSPAVPDGRTVTPINDVAIWQQCAGIANPTYTTLTEILADVGILSTLMASNNAVDYLVRCKDWTGIGLVPAMTSNTTPSGQVVFLSANSSYPAYLVFDGDSTTGGASASSNVSNGAYIGYVFTVPKVITSIYYASVTSLSNIVSVQGYDGNSWNDIATGITIPQSGSGYITFSNGIAYYGYRLLQTDAPMGANTLPFSTLQFYVNNICDNSNAMTYIGQNNYASNTLLADSDWCSAICNSTYFESVLNVKVPIMTGPTTPSGQVVAYASVGNTTSYPPYKAFNGDAIGGGILCQPATTAFAGSYVGYKFTESVKIKKVTYTPNTATGNSRGVLKVQGSNDGSVWTDLSGNVSYQNGIVNTLTINNNNNYQYCSLLCVSNESATAFIFRYAQFYGRADV